MIPNGTKIKFVTSIFELPTGDYPGNVIANVDSISTITDQPIPKWRPDMYEIDNQFYAKHWEEFIELEFDMFLNKAKRATRTFYDFEGSFYNKREMYKIFKREQQ